MALRQLAVCNDYESLITAIYRRAEELYVTRLSIDAVAGLPSGFSGKVLGAKKAKCLGAKSLFPLLGSLGLAIVLVEDPEALRKFTPRLQVRYKNLRHRPQPEAA